MGYKKQTQDSTKVKKKDFWACDRCEITSKTKGRMVPCPRGSCDAEIIGEMTITTEVRIFKKEKDGQGT